jgi:hypothetical protein
MYNYKLNRLGYLPILYFMFISGICAGSIILLIFTLLDRSSIGLFEGSFITLLIGLCSGLLGLIYTAVFNMLAPIIGGISLELTPIPDATISPSNSTASDLSLDQK